jgi:hypothetical protein
MYVSPFLRSIHNKSPKDSLTPRPSPISHGNPEIKPSKARIVLGWVTLLPLDFRCSLPPIFFRYFQPTIRKLRGLPLERDRSQPALSTPIQGVHLRKKAKVIRGPIILVVTHFEITYRIRPTQKMKQHHNLHCRQHQNRLSFY